MVTPIRSARGWSRATSGRLKPRSHLLTALSETKSFSARSFWVMPFSLRSWDKNVPNFSLSISYISLAPPCPQPTPQGPILATDQR